MFFLYLKPYHKSFPPVLLQGVVQFPARMECGREIIPDTRSVLYQVLVLYHIQDGQGCRACQVVPSESGPEHAVFGFYIRTYHHAPYRESVSHAFGHGHDVGCYPGVLVREEFPCPSVAGLYFIQDEESSVFPAQLFQ